MAHLYWTLYNIAVSGPRRREGISSHDTELFYLTITVLSSKD